MAEPILARRLAGVVGLAVGALLWPLVGHAQTGPPRQPAAVIIMGPTGTPANVTAGGELQTAGAGGGGGAPTGDVYIGSVFAATVAANKTYLAVQNCEVTKVVEVLYAKVNKQLTAAVTGLARGFRLMRGNGGATGPIAAGLAKLDRVQPALPAGIGVFTSGAWFNLTEDLGIVALNEEETGAAGVEGVLWDARIVGGYVPTIRAVNVPPLDCEHIVIIQDSTAGVGLVSALMVFRVR